MQHKMIYNINIKRQGNKRKLGNTDRSMYKTKQNEIQQKHEFNQKKKNEKILERK